MRYMATIYVSDVMDQVAMTVDLEAWEAQYGPPEPALRATYVFPGVGDSDPAQWLLRALARAAAEMSKAAREGMRAAEPMGVTHTLSETGDRAV
jgi:hypothetical protein